ncbi:unnamed protein product [Adineta ricciae]|uniref:Uncharacterized protein n=1 Tax=Adineta ricciae TaxID=249248 RepID=A0A815VFU9_ADIRI|nr:unnamed protein product [Adineta ricciae]CAF1529911.1 unnamed protein product [Adineta ricciae]
MQNIAVIWLDTFINRNNADCQYTINRLECITSDIDTFTDNDECVEFILSNNHNNIYVITSGSLGKRLVPCIHDIAQLHSIFIFCEDKSYHEQWTKGWAKVKGVFIDIASLCKGIEDVFRRNEQNTIPMSFVPSGRKPDQLDPSFMYTQLLKEILLTIDFQDEHIRQFIKRHFTLFAIDGKQVHDVEQLVHDYHTKKPIWWYTRGNDLHFMLNKALRVMDGDVLVQMGFFITDLHRNIEKLHKEQIIDISFSSTFTVYRGQGLPKAEFEELRKAKGGLMSFNNFLSTSTKRDVCLSYAESNADNADFVAVVFNIQVDPTQSTTPFAFIGSLGQFLHENEVLFSMHTVFRIQYIQSIGTARLLYEVNMSLTSDSDEELDVLTNHIQREKSFHEQGWIGLGQLLIELGQNDEAEEIFNTLLNNRPSDKEVSAIYHALGVIQFNRGAFDEGREFFRKALVLLENSLPANHSTIAVSYNNIGSVYDNMGDYPKALEQYGKALSIQQESLPANHPGLAVSYNNIGSVYHNMGDYPKALEQYGKALSIEQESLPANHPDLATSYNNIGFVYHNMGDYPKALEQYGKALSIRQQSLPANHPDLATSYNNTGFVYDNMGDYPKALEQYGKALSIEQQSLPANHPTIATSYNNIGSVYDNMGDYPMAHSYYERSIEIAKQSLLQDHPHLLTFKKNLEYLKEKV